MEIKPALGLSTLALLACLINPANATDFVVSKTTDSFDGVCNADCSLRDAVTHAGAQPGAHRILLGHKHTYQLTIPPLRNGIEVMEEDGNLNGDLDIVGEVTLLGSGSTIDGMQNDRILDIQPGALVRLEKLNLTRGKTSGYGGAVRNRGETNLERVTLSDNEVFSPGATGGGAIANFFVMRLHFTTLLNNQAFSEALEHGQGGGLYNQGNLWVRSSSIVGNFSSDGLDTGRGGGLYNRGYAYIARSTFSGNKLGEYGVGSAILNADGGVMQMNNSTISQNQAYYGRGALANGQYNSSENNKTQLLLGNVTIAANQGTYGLLNLGSLYARNSLIAGNSYLPDEGPRRVSNCANQGTYYFGRGLMIGRDGGNCRTDLPIDDAITFSQVLGPLASNGGFTPTHALLANSPAIDAGLGTCTKEDQRGVKRPQDGNGDGVAGCDLGAVERISPLTP